MPRPENIIPPKKGEVRNPNGRPIGSPNRATVAKRILQLSAKRVIPAEIKKMIECEYQNLDTLTLEEVMTMVMVHKAIVDKDVTAYRAVMDSRYGAPRQETDNAHKGEITIKRIIID